MAAPPRKPRTQKRAAPAAETARSQAAAPRKRDKSQPAPVEKPLPEWIAPCIPSDARQPASGAGWLHEIKWDGYRVGCYLKDGRATIRNRRGDDWTARFPAIAFALASLAVHNAVIDGEVVVLDSSGISQFGLLDEDLGWGKGKAARDAILIAFDLLFLDGNDLRTWTCEGRRGALTAILPATSDRIRMSEEITGDFHRIWRSACSSGLEGIISKRREAPYKSGRNRTWVKTKCSQSDTFVVVGYMLSPGTRRLGGLALAEERDGHLVPIDCAISGLSLAAAALKRRLDPLIMEKPAVTGLKTSAVIWTRPEVRVEIEHRGKTRGGSLRAPVFKGVRADG
ncbi:non-homologous end-joining DNA ligase [Chelatococcus reniformis]|uniref:DNA ligase (ATP) n=1 Tax=Chelatococcus reniformis TaxID=1494448 RepID=A0A916XR18_9HYPH|nr:non-homologous end-joining DNA ligase [Chelatococcus reniformis]GGC94130.1 ATP-dependent DNA ligase [Chelatococcus reniformis]